MGNLFSSPRSTLSNLGLTSGSVPHTLPESPKEQPVNIVPFESPRFEVDDPELLLYLREQGYAIVKSVASDEQLREAEEHLWSFLSEKCGMQKNDPGTWTDENFVKIGCTRNGILCFRGINQSKFLWYLRLLPKVKTAFARIFNTENLLTSFDGGSIFRPWHAPNADEYSKTSSGWFHVDQGNSLRGLQCVQGLVTLTDVTPQTGGFCVIPGTHRHHDELMETAARGGRNFVQVPGEHPLLQRPQVLPLCRAGDMILWDSRTIHANTPSLIPPTTSPSDLLRAVGYVCMTPADKASPEVLETRQQIFERGMGTTHWPHLLPYTVNTADPGTPVITPLTDVSPQQRALIVGSAC